MRRRKKFRLDLISGNLAAVFLLGIMFLLGGGVGCVLAGHVQGEGGLALQEYLQAYLTLAYGEPVQPSFWAVLWEQARFPLLILLLSFTAVGLVGIPTVFAAKGFLFAFSVSCFCRVFGRVGLIPALFLFGLPALLWTPALFVLGVQGMLSAGSVFHAEDTRPMFCQASWWIRSALCGGVVALCIALEYLILPEFIGFSASFVL